MINNYEYLLTSPEIQQILIFLKIGFIALALFFLAAIVFLLIKTQYLKTRFFQSFIEFLTYKPYSFRKTAKDWIKIAKRLDTASETEYKLAVIEAEEMLSNALEMAGHKGEAFTDQIREARKIRDNIVHNPDYRLSLDEAKRILKIYEQALKQIQAL